MRTVVVAFKGQISRYVDDNLALNFSNGSEVSKQEKVKVYPSVETQVNSSLGHINVTINFVG